MRLKDTSAMENQYQLGSNNSPVFDIFSSNSPGRLMNWASKSSHAIEIHTDDIKTDFKHALRGVVSQDIIEAIEESFNSENMESHRAHPVCPSESDMILMSNFQALGSIESLSSRTMPDHYSIENLIERIWMYHDQKASLFLQERLRLAVPGEFENIISKTLQNLNVLMVHRFGNFLVQCMLEVCHPDDILYFSNCITCRMAWMSKNQFGCHVIQRLLDVSPIVVQAHVAAELLEDVISTMTSPFGTHVWQKLLHIPWPPNLPRITTLANNAVHLEPNTQGWMTVAETEAGCATIKCFIGVGSMSPENSECVSELFDGISQLIIHPYGSTLIARLAVITTTRARTMALIFSDAYQYCKHPIASAVIMLLLKMKIPSFPVRLGAAIAPYYNDLIHDKYGAFVISTLESVQRYKY